MPIQEHLCPLPDNPFSLAGFPHHYDKDYKFQKSLILHAKLSDCLASVLDDPEKIDEFRINLYKAVRSNTITSKPFENSVSFINFLNTGAVEGFKDVFEQVDGYYRKHNLPPYLTKQPDDTQLRISPFLRWAYQAAGYMLQSELADPYMKYCYFRGHREASFVT